MNLNLLGLLLGLMPTMEDAMYWRNFGAAPADSADVAILSRIEWPLSPPSLGEGQVIRLDAEVRKTIPGWPAYARQGESDCTSHAVRSACQIVAALQDSVSLEIACEPIYGAWGTNRSAGMSAAYGARWVREVGYGAFRLRYGDIDLRTYSWPTARAWHVYGVGTPQAIRDAAATRKIANVARIRTWADARNHIAAQHPIVCCTTQYWWSGRTSDGFAKPLPSWWRVGHTQCWIGIDDRATKPAVLVLDSTNVWNSSQTVAGLPNRCAWVSKSVALRMINHGDTWAIW